MEEINCLYCGAEIPYGNYCRRCMNSMDEDVAMFQEVLSDGRYIPGKSTYAIEELDFNKHHNGKMRA